MLKMKKPKEVEEMGHLIVTSQVIGVLSMHKMPARAMQQIKGSLDARIRMSRKSLMLRALKASGKKDAESLSAHMQGSCALLFSEKNPFALYAAIKGSRSPAPAKAGDIAIKDIAISKGPTPLPPGPAISQLQKVGLKTSVQEGRIHVMQDKVMCKKGEEISKDLANVLGMLKLEPMEVGLDLVVAYEDGVLYGREVLDVDKNAYLNMVHAAISAAFNLSLNSGYLTNETAPLAIQKAFGAARSLARQAGVLERDFIGDVLAKAAAEAAALEKKMK